MSNKLNPPNLIKECDKETFADIANTIQNNLADAPFFKQFSKKQEEEEKTSAKTILYCLVYQNVHQTLQLLASRMIITK